VDEVSGPDRDLRAFVAIELPEDLKEHIYSRTRSLREVARSVKWVPAENLHITLKFLGSTEAKLLPAIEEALRTAAAGHGAFEMAFAGAGAFPGVQRPRVVWAGVEVPEGLAGLQRDVESALVPLGFEPEDRPFSPHLTLGRVKQPLRGGVLGREIGALEGESFGSFRVEGVSLMKSTLSPAGARYERLFSVPLSLR